MKHAEQNSDVHQHKYMFLFNISHRSYKFMILKRTEESNEKMRQKINNFFNKENIQAQTQVSLASLP